MPQEFYVLKCFSCETFQVHIVKKAKKWECKMCGAKQSLKRNYGKGSSKDCRNQVMKLNELRLSKSSGLTQIKGELLDEDCADVTEQFVEEEIKEQKSSVSKWAEFVDEKVADSESETEDNIENLWECGDRRKRVKKMQGNSYSKTKKICKKSSESEVLFKDSKETYEVFQTKEEIVHDKKNIVSKDFMQNKNDSKIGKYEMYIEKEEDLSQKSTKTNIFETNLTNLDEVLTL